jgi:hypothetical protein
LGLLIMAVLTSRYELLRSRLGPLKRAAARATDGKGPNPDAATHALRRAQAVVPVLELGHGTEDKVRARLRKALRRVKDLRNREALDRLIRDLQESDRPAKQALLALQLDRVRATAKKQPTFTKKDTSTIQAAADKLARLTEDYRDDKATAADHGKHLLALAAAMTAKRAGALKRAILEAGSVYLADRLGPPRRALRKLRNEAELLGDVGGPVTSGDLRALDRTLQALDRIRDLQRLIAHVRKSQSSLGPRDLQAWHNLDGAIIALENRCRRLHARYMRERPALLALCDQWSGASAPPGRRKAS